MNTSTVCTVAYSTYIEWKNYTSAYIMFILTESSLEYCTEIEQDYTLAII